jgi:hypothetical protein
LNRFVIRTAVALTFLVALTVFLAAGSPTASAATKVVASPHVSSTVRTPKINIASCSQAGVFMVYTTSSAWCFDNAGNTPATIPGAIMVYSGNHTGCVITDSLSTDVCIQPNTYVSLGSHPVTVTDVGLDN